MVYALLTILPYGIVKPIHMSGTREMRLCLALLATTTLSACGGAGVQTAGSSSTSSVTSVATNGAATTTTHSFVAPTETKTYAGIGGVHHYTYKTTDRPTGQEAQLYQGDATTARNSGISITYNPRDAIFDLSITQPLAGVTETIRFQDPAHRTNFGGDSSPQVGVPNLTSQGVNFLEVGTVSGAVRANPLPDSLPIGDKDSIYNIANFFYQKPGTTTRYVTFAGFIRNSMSTLQVTPNAQPPYLEQSYSLERGVFAFGERSLSNAVPRTGTGTYSGNMVATMVYNNLLDTDRFTPTYFQWLTGTSTTKVDFATSLFTLDLAGSVTGTMYDLNTSRVLTLQNGATFNASGSGRIDLANAGGFLGQFQTAYFTTVGGTKLNLTIGGSSADGTFFGPAAEEVGGGFRIVGGVPDERIDILGAFTGKK
jgi:C-lobe and N-lobe beta barrels of Tf-binding protein B